MENTAIIKSAQDGTVLELFDRASGYFSARFEGPTCHGIAKVYEYEPVHLKAFFANLAADWKGWKGKREWSSLEGELSLSATIDTTGHITLSVRIRSGPYPFDWSLFAALLLEAGQLDRISASINSFFDCPAQ
jgi:hypothetical protein